MSNYVYIDPQTDKPRVDRLRALARRSGFRIEKARGGTHINNRGGLQLVDVYTNSILAGVDYELTPEQAEYWIGHYRTA